MFVSGFVLGHRTLGAGVESVRALKDVRHALHRRGIRSRRWTRSREARIWARSRVCLALPLGRNEEMDLVLHDRTAQREAELLLLEIARAQERHVGGEILIAEVVVCRPVEVVRAALRHRIDERAREVPLAHVERRQQHLILLHRLERDRAAARLPTRLTGGAESENVALARAVDLNVVEAIVLSTGGQPRVLRLQHLRRERKEIGEVAVERGQAAKRRVRECPSALRGATARSDCSAYRKSLAP